MKLARTLAQELTRTEIEDMIHNMNRTASLAKRNKNKELVKIAEEHRDAALIALHLKKGK